jgi:hypothetical protein
MSAIATTLCVFSAALCNVGQLDQNLFGNQGQGAQQQQQQPQGNQQYGGGALINTATNIFGGLVGGLGGYNRPGGQGQGQGQRPPQQPHQSPCKAKFQYLTDGKQWKGIIKLKNIDVNQETLVEADFVLPQGQRRVR